ncbi:MAG TPA: PKD domain-containing protein [Methanospirillum sp.]|nr:PKD domain-containing protein [Methanospirillum sp.]
MAAVSVASRIGLATILLFSLVTIALAGAPALPCEFYGKVTIQGAEAPVGTIIVAKLGEEERGQFVLEQAGVYGGPGTFDKRLKVVAEDTDLASGTPKITFFIDGQKSWQEIAFQPGISQSLDLSVGGEPPVEIPTAVPSVIPVATPVETPVPESTLSPAPTEVTLPVEEEILEPAPEFSPVPVVTEQLVIPTQTKTPVLGAQSATPVSGAQEGLFADFVADIQSGEAPLTVQFTDLSIGNPSMWAWDFGDGSMDMIASPVHVYKTPGTYSVSLTVSSQDGTSDTELKIGFITVVSQGEIVADFTGDPISGATPLMVQFTDLSTGTPTMWAWDFGDGSTGVVADPVHIYEKPGNYTVSLTASDQFGLSNKKVRTNYITVVNQGDLVADFTGEPSNGDYPLTVLFSDRSVGKPLAWSWDFGDGFTDGTQNPVHVYQQPGLYTVALTIADENGSNSTKVREGYISVTTPGEVIADFTAEPTSGIVPLTVSFKDKSVGKPTLWAWDFGDGTSDMIANPVHVYDAEGTYTVSLTASSQDGGVSTKVKQSYLKVQGEPTPVPTLTVIPLPDVPESFYGSVQIYGNPIQVGGQVEAMVSGYSITSQFNPIKTAKGIFGKTGTFSPKLQVQGVPAGSEIEFWVTDENYSQVRALVQIDDGPLKWTIPYEPGKEKEIHLVVSEKKPTAVPTIPITPVPTDCPGVPSIPMTFDGDVHIRTGKEFLLENSSCVKCEPNILADAKIEARIDGYDVTGPQNPVILKTKGYFGGGNSSWADKLILQGRCVPEESNITFWVMDANWQRYVQAYLQEGDSFSWDLPYNGASDQTIHLWVGAVPTVKPTPTPQPTPETWAPQKFYGKAEFNGYPLREGDRVMATTEGVDLTSPTNPISVVSFGKYGDPIGNEMLTLDVPYDAMHQNDEINFWIKPQGFEYWYRAWSKNPLSGAVMRSGTNFTPASITNLDLSSTDREEFMYFYDIVSTIRNVILPEDYTGW